MSNKVQSRKMQRAIFKIIFYCHFFLLALASEGMGEVFWHSSDLKALSAFLRALVPLGCVYLDPVAGKQKVRHKLCCKSVYKIMMTIGDNSLTGLGKPWYHH